MKKTSTYSCIRKCSRIHLHTRAQVQIRKQTTNSLHNVPPIYLFLHSSWILNIIKEEMHDLSNINIPSFANWGFRSWRGLHVRYLSSEISGYKIFFLVCISVFVFSLVWIYALESTYMHYARVNMCRWLLGYKKYLEQKILILLHFLT